MSVTSEAETIEQALRLPDASRAELVGKLIASLPSPFVDEDEDWVEEALRRDREMDGNPESAMTEEEFFDSLRQYIK